MGFGDFASSTSKTKTVSPVYNIGAEGGSSIVFAAGRALSLGPGASYYRTGKGGDINLSVTGVPPSSAGTYLAGAIEGQGTSPVTGLPSIIGDGKKTLITGIVVAVVLFVVLFFVRK